MHLSIVYAKKVSGHEDLMSKLRENLNRKSSFTRLEDSTGDWS